MLNGIVFGLLAVYNALIIFEVVTRNTKFICTCSAIKPHGHHFKSPLLFTEAMTCVVLGITWYYKDTMDGRSFIIFALDAAIITSGLWQLWRWWVHTKNKRKKILKSLSRVRVTSAGLKVVPNNVT